MDFRSKFLISFMSKRAKNTLNLTSAPSEFSFQLSEDLLIHPEEWNSRIFMKTIKGNYLIGGEVMRLRFNSLGVTLKRGSIRKQLLLASHVLDAFPKSNVSVTFFDPIKPTTALEFMKMVNQRKISIKTLDYSLNEASSSEFVPELLDECTEVTKRIKIRAAFPDDFMYTPVRPFKVKELIVLQKSNWINLESLISCRTVVIQLTRMSNRTVHIYDSFFNKWMDSNAPLQKLTFYWGKETENQLMMDALSNQGEMQQISRYWVKVDRKDGSEFFIDKSSNGITIHTKKSYLKQIREAEIVYAKVRAIERQYHNRERQWLRFD
uniref:FBA_2 domain-containing protein n=1 Tax=Caenorhabditis tropicalis TaxID=1561998 RepID=A0A1I7UTR9_9PELO